MINTILLKGFKSFYDRDLPLNTLTILTGLNSSGKSTIIQAILIFEKICNKEKNFLLEGHGSIEELKNNNYDGNISIGVEINNNTHTVELPLKKQIEIDVFPEIWYVSANRFGPKSSIPIYNESNLINKIGSNGENVLQCIKYYEDLYPQPLHETLKHPNTEAFTLLANIRSWLKEVSPNTEFNYEVINKNDSSYATFNDFRSTNVGFGLSYILPVITTLLVSTFENNRLVIIENPEAHLHPKGQSQLAKLICLCANLGTQVIIETHSDHIFDGIRVATKELESFSNKVQIHWFELDENKNTEVTSPVIDDNGMINEWPKGFFDQFEINSSKLI